MNSFAKPLAEIQSRCTGNYSISEDERTLVHNAYWNGNAAEICSVLEIMCYEPDSSDLPMLLDASSPGSWYVHRCDAAQALGGLGDEGAAILRIMAGREKHPLVKFYVLRELIDLEDESVTSLLDMPIPSNSSPGKRSLWVYGNYERGELTGEEALAKISRLLEDPKRRHDWLWDHLQSS